MQNNNKIDNLYRELNKLQEERLTHPRKNDFDRRKKIIKLKNQIIEINKSN